MRAIYPLPRLRETILAAALVFCALSAAQAQAQAVSCGDLVHAGRAIAESDDVPINPATSRYSLSAYFLTSDFEALYGTPPLSWGKEEMATAIRDSSTCLTAAWRARDSARVEPLTALWRAFASLRGTLSSIEGSQRRVDTYLDQLVGMAPSRPVLDALTVAVSVRGGSAEAMERAPDLLKDSVDRQGGWDDSHRHVQNLLKQITGLPLDAWYPVIDRLDDRIGEVHHWVYETTDAELDNVPISRDGLDHLDTLMESARRELAVTLTAEELESLEQTAASRRRTIESAFNGGAPAPDDGDPEPRQTAAASRDATPAESPLDAAAEAPAAAPGGDDIATQLSLMRQLLDQGLIDEAEFERRRTALLDRAFGSMPAEPAAPAAVTAPSAPPPGALPADAPQVPDVDWGDYYALVIGINEYEHLPKLKTAVADANRIAGLLEGDYGYSVKRLINPTHKQLVDALDVLRETLGGNDNLLIYYAGHGWLDEAADRGYWLPVDAEPNRRSHWVSNATLIDTLRTLLAKHVIVIADSCFSGTLTRNAPITLRSADYWEKIAAKAARVTLTSGGLEPVADDGGSGHSPFASAFIDALEENPGVMDGTSLFAAMRRPVMLNANQTPEYSDVRQAGHDGGDFVFVKRP